DVGELLGEVTIEHRHAQDAGVVDLLAGRRLRALEAGLFLAHRRATVAVFGVAVVALFVDQEAVAALGFAAVGGAGRLGLAERRAAVERHRVAVVAALGAFLLTVAAGRLAAGAGLALALEARLELAGRGATITGDRVTVVALLGGADDAVAAHHELVAKLAGRV